MLGMNVIVNDSIFPPKYIQKRRNKRKRINKKYLKKYGYVRVDTRKAAVYDGSLVCNSYTYNKLIKEMKRVD